MADTPRSKPRWFEFRLRMLLVLLIPIVLVSGWLSVNRSRAQPPTVENLTGSVVPLTLSVVVKREGRLLNLDCQLLDANGRKYQDPDNSTDRTTPPEFAIYQGDQKINSGSFEYG
jgi:hypothetical protein